MATVMMDDGQVKLLHGHVLEALKLIPDESVACCVTSPPYWALRSYQTEPQVWGGDPDHDHLWTSSARDLQKGTVSEKQSTHKGNNGLGFVASQSQCHCGAWRGELGHEPTPQLFVEHLVEVFREVRRVLKSDGCCFVNIGDSYSGSGKGPSSANGLSKQHTNMGSLIGATPRPDGLKSKDLVLIPERFVLAMQADGWWVRSRIAWCKRAPMPESIKDRPTNAWEHIWMLTKSARYYWDADAVREAHARLWDSNNGGSWAHADKQPNGSKAGHHSGAYPLPNEAGRNMWSYWLLSPDPEPLAHFATFPREIPRRCIAAATREGDTVLDPFVGSGTTTMVARSMLRRSIGIDLSETYLRDIALKKNAQMALMP